MEKFIRRKVWLKVFAEGPEKTKAEKEKGNH